MSTRNIRDHLVDHLAIQDLVSRYTNGVNQRDWAAVRDVFTDDSEWNTIAPDGSILKFAGIEQVFSGIRGIVEPYEILVQTIHAAVVDVQGNRATITSTTHETARINSDQGFALAMGTYYDEAIRCADGEWRFRKRSFRVTYFDTTVPNGLALARFPLAQRPYRMD